MGGGGGGAATMPMPMTAITKAKGRVRNDTNMHKGKKMNTAPARTPGAGRVYAGDAEEGYDYMRQGAPPPQPIKPSQHHHWLRHAAAKRAADPAPRHACTGRGRPTVQPPQGDHQTLK